MDSLMQNSAYFGFFITLMGYWCAVQVGKRMRSTLCNPLLLSIIFIIIGFATIFEYIFVRGMFTSPLVMGLAALAGVVNIVFEIINKHWLSAIRYLLTTAALCMGYIVIMLG